MIKEKQAFMVLAHLSVEEFLYKWNEHYDYLEKEPKEPTQEDYDKWLMRRATYCYIGEPSESQVFLEEVC
jgi:hypothetical protein